MEKSIVLGLFHLVRHAVWVGIQKPFYDDLTIVLKVGVP
jgi:hypothetical protein